MREGAIRGGRHLLGVVGLFPLGDSPFGLLGMFVPGESTIRLWCILRGYGHSDSDSDR